MSETNGKIVNGWSRECDKHGRHGILYECPDYPEETRLWLKQKNEEWRHNLLDQRWIDEQVARGVPSSAIAIMQAFGGVL